MTEQQTPDDTPARPTSPLLVAAAWAVVAIPLLYGLTQTILKAAKLFTG